MPEQRTELVEPRGRRAGPLFSGAGSARAHCRTIDWEATPLGVPGDWPAALSIAVTLCLDAPIPAWLWWGREPFQLCNDAALTETGMSAADAVAVPARRAWGAGWRDVGPPIERVLATGVAWRSEPLTIPAGAHARGERRALTLTATPLRDDRGCPAGVFLLATDAAPRTEPDRALGGAADTGILAEGFRAVFEAAPMPLLVVTPHDFRIAAVNRAYERATMSRREEMVGRAIFEVFPDNPDDPAATGVANLRRSLERTVATGRVDIMPVQRYDIRRPAESGGGFEERWWSPLNNPVLGTDGKVALIVHRVEDVTELVRRRRSAADHDRLTRDQQAVIDQLRDANAQAALAGELTRTTELRYRALFASIDEGLSVVEVLFDDLGIATDARVIESNPAFERQSGLPSPAGRTIGDLVATPDPGFLRALGEIATSGIPARFEVDSAALGRCFDVYAFRVEPGTERRVAVLFNDITARKQVEASLRESESRQAFLVRLGDALRALTDPVDVEETAARLLGEHLGADRASYSEVVQGIVHVTHDYARDVPSLAGRHPLEVWGRRVAEAYARGETVVVRDVHTDSIFAGELLATYEHARIAAGIMVALPKGQERGALLAVGSATPREWTPAEVRLVREVAERTWADVERARAEAQLRMTQARLDETLATARMAYWSWDLESDEVVASPALSELLGLPSGEPMPRGLESRDLLHPDDRARHDAIVADATARGDGWLSEFRVIRPIDGRVVWLEERATVTRDAVTGRVHLGGLVWDVTERKLAAEAEAVLVQQRGREHLRRRLAGAEEEERRRLARELHDQLGQHLTAFVLGLGAVRRALAEGALRDAEARITPLEDLARLMTRDARHLALELRPPELDDVGFESALESYVALWRTRYGIDAELSVTGRAADRPLPTEVGTALYRIAQEALTNVARHASARQVSVVVEKPEGEVRLVVEDDGCGFDPAAATQRIQRERRLGLASMRERAALVGGTLEVESSPGAGTALFVRVPLDDQAVAMAAGNEEYVMVRGGDA